MNRKTKQTIVFIFSALSLAASTPKERLAEKLFSIYELYNQAPESEEIDQALKELDHNFPDPSDIVREAESKNWGNPSPDRIKAINSIGRVIEPYAAMLADLAYKRGGVNRHRAERFIWFLPPNEANKSVLLEVSEDNPSAFRALFQTGMFDKEVRQAFVQNLKDDKPFESRWRFAQLSAEWGLPEAIPTYKDALSMPFDPTQISFVGQIPAEDGRSGLSFYRLASTAAAHLGSEGQSLLPLLRKRFKEIQASFPDRYNVLTAGMAMGVEVLEGKIEQQLETVINGRGAINLIYGYKPIPHDELRRHAMGIVESRSTEEIVETVENVTPSEPANAEPGEADMPEEPSEEPDEKSSNWWLWLIGLLVVVGGLAVVVRRKI